MDGDEPFTLRNLIPADISQPDIDILHKMFNKNEGHATIGRLLEEEVNQKLGHQLNAVIHQKDQYLDPIFYYAWTK